MTDRDPSLQPRSPEGNGSRPLRRALRHPDEMKKTQAPGAAPQQRPAQTAQPRQTAPRPAQTAQPRQTAQRPAQTAQPRPSMQQRTAQTAQPRQTAQRPARAPVNTGKPAASRPVRTGKKKKGGIPRFYIALAVIFAILTVAVLASQFLIRDWTDAYEKSWPSTPAGEKFNELFADRDFLKVVNEATSSLGPYETPEQIAAQMKATAEGKELIYYPVVSGENEARYAVSVIDENSRTSGPDGDVIRPVAKLATMTFVKNENPGRYGLYNYTYQSTAIELRGDKSIKISVPSSYSLFINGVPVAADEKKEEVASPLNEFLTEGVPGLYYTEYTVSGLFAEPVLTCTAPGGTSQTVSGENGVYTASLQYDEELKSKLTDTVLAGIRAYMARMSDDGGLGAVSRYFDVKSAYYKSIAENPSTFVWDHNGQSFPEQSAEDFYAFDESTFCCRVKMVQHLHMYGREDYVERFDEIIFVHKCSDGSWGIYDHVKPEVVENNG